MKKYLLAEHLKHKRSFLKKLCVVAPLISPVAAFVLMPLYFAASAYNWWYVFLLQGTFALVAGLVHRREERNLHYRAVYCLSVDLGKVWISKVLVASAYLLFVVVLHFLSVEILQSFVSSGLAPRYEWSTLLFGSIVLLLVNLWQAPLCLYLAKKIGFMASLVGNTLLGAAAGILFADSPLWWFCPYAWGARLMVPILHVLPNGLVANAAKPMIEDTSVGIPCIVSLGLYFLLIGLTARWFSAQEVE
ncbi:MAG: lantibiotic immunity ABC transporter MutE/EpiE family permease subunit [Peptoniphilus sp.]|nr:lantibiotic immunity ABC transporter MutE/EpiE family permease subunit [Peptoniphilus sp.]MDY3119044.1 lantibiotic immunity ABC transporter MutE/EpiE family permease subunit [Peptoniphilus sp.]